MDVTSVNNKYNQEQTNIIKCLLDNRFFNPWKEPLSENYRPQLSLNSESALEIYITSTCNQHCEYCYLVKNPELYPKEYNNKELILKNLEILYNWCIENKYHIPRIDFFTGEIWQSSYGLDVLEVTFQALQRGLEIGYFLIPSNCSFILDPIQTARIQHCIDKFKQIGHPLIFSISVDGAVVEDENRPLNDSTKFKNDRFYEDLFLFARHNRFGFHPMVSSKSVHKWIENYKWWMEMSKKYDYETDELIMMLEVRNNDWTEESIKEYNNFMGYLIDEEIKKSGGTQNFLKKLFLVGDNSYHGYVPFSVSTEVDTFAGCSISNCICVRLGDLAICPCHRLAYNKYLYGHFVVEDNHIVDIVGNNPEVATRILMANNNLVSIQCDSCLFNKVCLKGCFGSQYEVEKDPFFPVENVCEFFRGKYSYLIKRYLDMGVIEFLEEISPYSLNYLRAQRDLEKFKLFKEGLKL